MHNFQIEIVILIVESDIKHKWSNAVIKGCAQNLAWPRPDRLQTRTNPNSKPIPILSNHNPNPNHSCPGF